MRRLLPYLMLFCLPFLAACNTVAGAGQDIQAGGEVVEDTAEDVQQQIQ